MDRKSGMTLWNRNQPPVKGHLGDERNPQQLCEGKEGPRGQHRAAAPGVVLGASCWYRLQTHQGSGSGFAGGKRLLP